MFVRRFEGYLQNFSVEKGIFIAIELVGTLLLTFFLLRILSLGGRTLWKVLVSLVVLISAGASYYMTNLNVVIGYGIIASVMTTDVDLSKEVVGWHFISWLVLTSIVPLIFIWLNGARDTLLQQLRTRGQRIRSVAIIIDPAKKFTYVAPEGIDDTYVVFIIGETTRWDHMGLFGYGRDTTPELAKEKNLVAFRGYSCDTATKLSLRCMFVRQGGASDNPQRTVKEQNVFAVLHQLGFTGDLLAMQSELWFYSNTMANNIAYREQIGAEPRNRGKSVDDMLLADELKNVLARSGVDGKHLIIIHTKGSHFNYTQRYPRNFAKWKPECVNVDDKCTKAELINSYDNSITYVDHFLVNVFDQMRDKKAIVFFASDHGESINEHERLHGTPRKMAPPEQFRVPMMVWMSDKYLENPDHARSFAYLQQQAAMKQPKRHVELYDTIMGCLGYTSPDGGINEYNNWCHVPAKPVNAQ